MNITLNKCHPSNQPYIRVRVMVFNATFNNISVMSWWSVLLVEETPFFFKDVLKASFQTLRMAVTIKLLNIQSY
jgi:hypothetical protein